MRGRKVCSSCPAAALDLTPLKAILHLHAELAAVLQKWQCNENHPEQIPLRDKLAAIPCHLGLPTVAAQRPWKRWPTTILQQLSS